MITNMIKFGVHTTQHVQFDVYNIVSWLVDTPFDYMIKFADDIPRTRSPSVKHKRASHCFRVCLHQSRRIFGMSALVALQVTRSTERPIVLDTDAYSIGIDSRCSGCMSGFTQDFVGPLNDTDRVVKGFMGAQSKPVKIGTL